MSKPQQNESRAPEVNPELVAEVAFKASVDARSVRKALMGQPVRGLAGWRIQRVLKELGA